MGQSACDQGGLDCRDGVVWVVGVVRVVRVVGLVRKVEVVSFNFKIPCSASNFRHFHSGPYSFWLRPFDHLFGCELCDAWSILVEI